MPIAWLDWGQAAFARARREDRPVLLALVAPWCEHCAAMDRTTYARADVQALVAARFVPIRVNTDRRPDLDERYNLGGWPTTAFLTPEGEVFGGGTYLDPSRMPGMLARVADTFAARRGEIGRARGMRLAAEAEEGAHASDDASLALPDAEAPDDPVPWLCARIADRFDAAHGGFGEGAKFPSVPALALLLARVHDTGDARMARVLRASLDGLDRLRDPVDGGYFRYAAARDWSAPQTEKTLRGNAEIVRLLLDAGEILDAAACIERALAGVQWVHRVLAGSEGRFGASQAADRAYYDLPDAAARAARSAPPVDPAVYADGNADMIAADLRAAGLTGDRGLEAFALRAVDEALLAAYRPGAGLAHVVMPEPAVWGLLADQVAAAQALLVAHAATGLLPYSMLAAELMAYAIGSLWDEARGAFRDRPAAGPDDDADLPEAPYWPFAANCEAARTLARLAIVTGRADHRARACRILASLGAAYRADPIAGACYGLAIREVRDGRLPAGLDLAYVDWQLPR